jgi:hypothetical protein
MSETVDAIGYRTDVKTRTRDALARRKDAVVNGTSSVVNKVVGAMPDVPSTPDVSMPGFVPDGDEVKDVARRGVSTAQSNPIGLGVASVAFGFLIGMFLPASQAEDARLGELSDELKDQARSAGQEAFDRGKTVAQDVARSAGDAVQESGQQQAGELADSLRDSARELKPS